MEKKSPGRATYTWVRPGDMGYTTYRLHAQRMCRGGAHEGRNTLAMLKRRKGESLAQLLSRLDLAIARAHTEDVFTDEINPPAEIETYLELAGKWAVRKLAQGKIRRT